MRALVVYYSRTGHTKKIAEEIVKGLQCDSEEIIDTVNRKGPIGYLTSGKQATKKELTTIKPVQKDPSAYDLVIIGTPVWAMTMSTPVRTYITENKGKLGKVAFFITMGTFHADPVFRDLEELCGKKPEGTLVVNTASLKENTYAEGLKQFIDMFRGQ